MDIIENIIQYFSSNSDQEENCSPLGTCPACWGFQQYNGKIRDLLKDKQIDINNHKESYWVIKEFMVTHIDGIQLKDGIVSECPTCKKE